MIKQRAMKSVKQAIRRSVFEPFTRKMENGLFSWAKRKRDSRKMDGSVRIRITRSLWVPLYSLVHNEIVGQVIVQLKNRTRSQ